MPDTTSNTSLLQGSQLPSTVTTKQSQTVAPEFYTNYLQDIANLGQNAVTQGGVAGLSPLQEQAFQMAPTASFAGADTMGAATEAYGGASGLAGQGADVLGQSTNMLTSAGTTTAPSVIDQYMNPYTRNVVDEMTRQNQLNVQRNILPALKAMGVGTGGLGSSRLANVSGQTLADIQSTLTGQQYGALSQGYKDAMSAAQEDLRRQYQAGTGLTSAAQGYGNLSQNLSSVGQGLTETGKAQQGLSLAGLKNLSELGSQEQAQGQKLLDYPMLQAQNFAKLMQGYQVPTGTVDQTTQPGQQGQFTNAPLAQIAGLLTALGAFGSGYGGNTNTNLFSSLSDALKGLNIKDGGAIRKADGGAISGGLQSMVQGLGSNMNSNIPVAENPINARIPNTGINPPRLNIQSLNYQNDPEAFNLNTSTMTGNPPNTSLMVG